MYGHLSFTTYITHILSPNKYHNSEEEKMVGKVSAQNAFGQVLICLRLSKLNYTVKETPYSGYLTIRKTFVKEMENEEMEH